MAFNKSCSALTFLTWLSDYPSPLSRKPKALIYRFLEASQGLSLCGAEGDERENNKPLQAEKV